MTVTTFDAQLIELEIRIASASDTDKKRTIQRLRDLIAATQPWSPPAELAHDEHEEDLLHDNVPV